MMNHQIIRQQNITIAGTAGKNRHVPNALQNRVVSRTCTRPIAAESSRAKLDTTLAGEPVSHRSLLANVPHLFNLYIMTVRRESFLFSARSASLVYCDASTGGRVAIQA